MTANESKIKISCPNCSAEQYILKSKTSTKVSCQSCQSEFITPEVLGDIVSHDPLSTDDFSSTHSDKPALNTDPDQMADEAKLAALSSELKLQNTELNIGDLDGLDTAVEPASRKSSGLMFRLLIFVLVFIVGGLFLWRSTL